MEEKLIGVVIVLEGKAHTRSLFVTCLGDCLLSDRLFEDMENLYRLWCSMGKGYFVSGSGGEQQRCAPHDKDKRKLN